MHQVQHGGAVETRVVEQFEATDLGAPFKVILIDAVRVTYDKATGEAVRYAIPNLDGLVGTIVLSRILHPRKLFSADVKFLRKALGIKQTELAEKLVLEPETLSRIESGAQPLGPSSEKLLRIFALKSVFKIDKFKASEAKTKLEDSIDKVFDLLKPTAVFDVKDELVFYFSYSHRPANDISGSSATEDGHWIDKEAKAA